MKEILDFEWSIQALRPAATGKTWVSKPRLFANNRLIFSGYLGTGEVRIFGSGRLISTEESSPDFVIEIYHSNDILFHIEHWQNGTLQQIWEVVKLESNSKELSTVNELVSNNPSYFNPFALRGRMGQLFLGGDSNDSIGQFTEERVLSSSSTHAWRSLFKNVKSWKSSYNVAQLDLLIAPSKEEIFREYYPLPRAAKTITDDFFNTFHSESFIWPKWELFSSRYLSYCITDTHWTDYGATTAALKVLRKWAIPTNGLPTTFLVKQRIGDLGGKAEPKIASYQNCFSSETSSRIAFNNGIVNQGNIRVFRNPSAPNPGVLLIFGDSFGTNLAEAFSGVFSEVVFAYQPAGIDPELVSTLTPTHILLQITQRFLHGQPATGMSVFKKAREKISQLPETKRIELLKEIHKYSNDFPELCKPHFI